MEISDYDISSLANQDLLLSKSVQKGKWNLIHIYI